jgi:F-type H+-transporting ATPase subunit gamma
MANLRDIRRRIKSVKNTAQITRAMQLVAAAKMKKAQDQALAGRDYAGLLHKVLCDMHAGFDDGSHPLLEKREGGKELVFVISTDKGLCGALNTNLARKIFAEKPDADILTVGRKLRANLTKAGYHLVADYEVKDPVPFAEARPIAKQLTQLFLEGNYNRISIAFTRFISTLSQEPVIVPLLPISEGSIDKVNEVEGGNGEPIATTSPGADYLFEPSPMGVLDAMLPLFINFQVYQMLVESRASEHSARMVAMKAATDNANKFIKELTLEYNKLRQAAITAELLEITTAMRAME